MKTFSQRLALHFATLVTATTAVVLAIGGWLMERQMIRSTELLHSAEFKELRGLIGSDTVLSNAELTRRIQRDADSDSALYLIQVHSDRGEILFRSPNLGANVLPDLSGHDLHGTLDLPGLGPTHVSEFHDGPWHVQVASALAPLRRLLRDYLQISAGLALSVAVLSLGLGYAFSQIALRPVRAIAATANRIRSDNLSERIPVPPGRDELAALTSLLNQMFDRLEIAFDQVRRFTADASHELKTPLALIRLNAERLRPRFTSDPEGLATLEELLEEISRLHQIIESLLFLSRAESGALEVRLRSIDTTSFVADFAEDAVALAQDQHVHFSAPHVDTGEIRAEPTLLRQLLLNLVTNAIAVSPAGGAIALHVRHNGGIWRLELTDEGPGLRPEQLERAFERFVRFEPPPGRPPTAGNGLGLAIARSIARLHAGTLRAETRTDRSGLRVIVELPG